MIGRGEGVCKVAAVAGGAAGAVAAGVTEVEAVRDCGRDKPTLLPRPRVLEPLEVVPDMRSCCHIYCLLDISFNSAGFAPHDGCRRT
jgi:hypothetical protein